MLYFFNPVEFDGDGRSWLARLLWEQEVVGSSPTSPTTKRHG